MTAVRFDEWARSYDASPLQPAYHTAHLAVLTAVLRHVTQPVRLLDVGCGSGRFLHLAATSLPAGSSLTGVDASAGMLAAAVRLSGIPGCARVRATAESLPFTDATFDVVVSTWAYRHWHDQQAGIREVARVLASGGLVALAGLLHAQKSTRPTIPVPSRPALTAGLVTHLDAAGLRPTTVRLIDGFGPIPAITVVVAHRSRVTGRSTWLRPPRFGRGITTAPADPHAPSS
jgi:SAM-dependent methyltransferase